MFVAVSDELFKDLCALGAFEFKQRHSLISLGKVVAEYRSDCPHNYGVAGDHSGTAELAKAIGDGDPCGGAGEGEDDGASSHSG